MRKWEMFSDEELNIIIGDLFKANNNLIAQAESPITFQLWEEIRDEQNFRLAEKDAESESRENLESAGMIHDRLLAEAHGDKVSKMTHPTGEFELLEDEAH